jgi:hypothetical protein
MSNILIETPKGIGRLHNIYVSELGFLMIKIEFENGTFSGYNLGKYNPENNIFTKELFKDEFIGLTRD